MPLLQVTIGASATQFTTQSIECSHVVVQNNDSTNDFRVGDSSVASTKGYKVLHATGAPMVIGPLPVGRYVDLSTLWVAGTQNGLVDVYYVSA